MKSDSYSNRKSSLIAPCGMNCGICRAYLRRGNKCTGCRGPNDKKPITRIRCKIKTCDVFRNGTSAFCFQCKNFPCGSLEHLDKRYRTKYRMSMIENLENIRNHGIRNFVKSENERWTCLLCGGTICVHNRVCVNCGGEK